MSNPITTTYQRILLVLVPAVLYLSGCSPLKKNLRHLDQNPVFAQSFTGFVLFDPENNQILFDHQGSKYFTPASNTKLFTFYAANKILGDSIAAFEYQQQGDSIWLWGTGDPSFLNPDLPPSGTFDFLQGKEIFLVRDRFKEPQYGPGWAWDDYSGSYQRPKATFPIYGNALHISWDSLQNLPVVIPRLFTDSVLFDAAETERALLGNTFTVSHKWEKKDTINIPFYADEGLYKRLWSDTLGGTVSWADTVILTDPAVFYSIAADSIYQKVLQDSDNFLAEQLILLCSWKLFGELDSGRTIELLSDSLLSDLPEEPIWVDGSGLSRYNLFTPRSLVALLNKIYREVSMERIFSLFPAGGESGTIKDYYASDPPYIYAKTGTLRNNHALSGYLITKKGKVLIFSFMHNHYAGGSDSIKKEMEKLLWQVRMKY